MPTVGFTVPRIAPSETHCRLPIRQV